MPGCGYSRDPFICKHKHVILYWWDHHMECSQNDTEKECEHSPASVWCVTACLLDGKVISFRRGHLLWEIHAHTRVRCQKTPESSSKFWRQFRQVRFIAQSWNVSAVGQIQYVIPSVQGSGKFLTVTKKQLSKTFFSSLSEQQNRKLYYLKTNKKHWSTEKILLNWCAIELLLIKD